MSWLILLLISIITYSTSIILQKILMKNHTSDPIAYSIFFQLVVGFFIALHGFFTTDMSVPNLIPLLPNLLITIILYGVAGIFIFKSLQLIEASQFTVLFASRAIFTMLASFIFIQEVLNGKQLLGAALVLGGIVLVTNVSLKTLKLSKGQIFAIISAMGFGFANTNDRFLLQNMNAIPFTAISFIAPALLTAMIFPKKVIEMKQFFEKSTFIKLIALCVIYAISALTFFIALKIAPNSSQVVTINQMCTIIITLLGIIILKEKTAIPKKLMGAVLSVIGVLLII